MANIAGTLYSGIFEQREQFPQWGLTCLVERLAMSQARWCVVAAFGMRELAMAGLVGGAQSEYTTLRIEILDPVENSRHEFTWQRVAPASFSDEERRFLSEALEHLVGAERLSRRLQNLLRETDPVGFAIVDVEGVIESADRVFEDYLRGSVPNWDGRQLPFRLDEQPKMLLSGIPHAGLYDRFDPVDTKLHVRVRRDRRAPSVSGREMQVARKLAGGLTFKEIARDLGLAPSTVSTHAYNLYDKLGIRRRAQLVEWVHRQYGQNG